jgi:hypothetical protein
MYCCVFDESKVGIRRLPGGWHELSDPECLDIAQSIREILFELAERIGEVLKVQAGLDAAIARLTNRQAPVR